MALPRSRLNDPDYVALIAGQPHALFTKYVRALLTGCSGDPILDVGCGTGQALALLRSAGARTVGTDISKACVLLAHQAGHPCILSDGACLPFPDGCFAAVGAFNVLEHLEEPEQFIEELVRVTRRGGRVVLSSPNFLRVIGFRDYHERMRGLRTKWRNLCRLLVKRRQMLSRPHAARFDRVAPALETPPAPDDDVIVLTNPVEMRFFLEHSGCEVLHLECTDREVPRPLDRALNLSPLRLLMLNSFLVARRM